MSKIKGGGRAQLNSDAEESIISLLYDLRDPKNPLRTADTIKHGITEEGDEIIARNRKSYADLSDHDRKKERKRFLKNLLKHHNRVVLSNKFNQAPAASASTSFPNTTVSAVATKTSRAIEASESSGKVRIEIVEMIFKEKKDKPKKDEKKKKKSSKKEKKGHTWKEGTKKILVLPRCTTIKQLMVQCKAKLKMKIPTRIFIQDKDTNQEVDLEQDLQGVQDGTIVCATSYSPPAPLEETPEDSEKGTLQEEGEEFMIVDPLENVKKAYRTSTRKKHKENTVKVPLNEPLPPFSDAINKLEPLSDSRSKLPAANYRSEILSSLDSSRVIVISGATGCG